MEGQPTVRAAQAWSERGGSTSSGAFRGFRGCRLEVGGTVFRGGFGVGQADHGGTVQAVPPGEVLGAESDRRGDRRLGGPFAGTGCSPELPLHREDFISEGIDKSARTTPVPASGPALLRRGGSAASWPPATRSDQPGELAWA